MSSTDGELHNLVEQLDITHEAKKALHDQIRNADTLVPSEVERLRALITGENPRIVSEAITEGNIGPQHLGKHTPETLTQEVVSLGNTKPMFRNKDWTTRAYKIKATIRSQMKENPRFYQGLLGKIDGIIQGEM